MGLFSAINGRIHLVFKKYEKLIQIFSENQLNIEYTRKYLEFYQSVAEKKNASSVQETYTKYINKLRQIEKRMKTIHNLVSIGSLTADQELQVISDCLKINKDWQEINQFINSFTNLCMTVSRAFTKMEAI